MDVRSKIVELLKSGPSNEVKALCESFLEATADKSVKETDEVAVSLFEKLKATSDNQAINKINSENNSHRKAVADLEMEISKSAAQNMITYWDRIRRDRPVSNVGNHKDNTMSTANAEKNKSESALMEGMTALSDVDASAKKFVDKAKVYVFGIRESINSIKKSPISTHPQLKYVLARFEKNLDDRVSESVLLRDYISSISAFKWDSTVNESYIKLDGQLKDRAADVEVQNAIYAIKSTDKKGFFSGVVDKMESWLMNEKRNVKELVNDLRPMSFSHVVKGLVNNLMMLESSKGTTFNVPIKSSNCTVAELHSPVAFVEGGQVFRAGSNFFVSTKDGVRRLTEENVNALPKSYIELCEAFFDDSVKVVEGKVTTYIGKNKVQIFEGRITVNGRDIDPNNVGVLLTYAHTSIFKNDSSKINLVKTIHENINSIYEIDYGKSIFSNLFEGCGVYVFKKNDKIYINKVNKSMNEDKFFVANGTQTSKLVKEFLSYNMSEALADFLEGEQKAVALMEKELKDVVANIALMEGELDKIEKSIADDPYVGEFDEIQKAKNIIENELASLKSKWQKVSEDIKAFENADEEVESEVEGELEEITDAPSKNDDAIDSGLIGAEGKQDATVVSAAVTPVPATEGGNVVDAGFNGAEGAQDASVKGSDVIKQEAQPVPVITPGADAEKIEQKDGSEIPVSGNVPVVKGEEKKDEVVPPTDKLPEEGDDKDGQPAEKGEEKGDVKEALKVNSPVKIKSNGKSGKVSAINDTVYSVLLDDGKTEEVNQEDLEDLTEVIENKKKDNEEAAKDVKDQDVSAATEEPTVTEEEQTNTAEGDVIAKPAAVSYVKAKMDIDLGPYKQGDIVEIDAAAYTSSGEEDPIGIKEPKEDVKTVTKKYLKIVEETPVSPAPQAAEETKETE